MDLSNDCVLVFVLRPSGVRGRLTAGRVEQQPGGDLSVLNSYGMRNDYISGRNLRSWQVFRHGFPLEHWSRISAEDVTIVEMSTLRLF